MDQEKWINEVFDSTKGMHKAEPSPFLFEQVIAKVRSGNHKMEHSSQGSSFLRWGLAFFVSAAIFVNLVFIFKDRFVRSSSQTDISYETNSSLNNAIIYSY